MPASLQTSRPVEGAPGLYRQSPADPPAPQGIRDPFA